jgi:hypothetical protein
LIKLAADEPAQPGATPHLNHESTNR